MRVAPQQFMNDGYLILRGVIPPEHLEPLRACIEHMVARRREVSAQRGVPGEPPGGAWEASAQPRLSFDRDCDEQSILAIQCLLHENTLGVSRRLMNAEHVVPHNFNCLCSPVSRDFGPAQWHRDIAPGDPAPLRGMIASMMSHGPSYLQWNIALYDDSVLWIVPGSHRRVNTEDENGRLSENPSVPLPGGIPVELGAGDGVVYTHLLLHWGSDYSRKLRRAIHPGYRPFGFPAFPNVHWRHWAPGFFHYLPADERRRFEQWDRLFFDEFDRVAAILHAVRQKDSDGFFAALQTLHPSPKDRMVCLVMLSKLASRIYRLKHTNAPPAALWGNGRDMAYLGSRFTPEEAAEVWRRFHILDDRLKFQEKRGAPGFQGDQSFYNPDDMPAGFEVEDFVESWGRTQA